MKERVHNANIDVVVEGKDRWDIMQNFARDYPQEIHNAIFIDPLPRKIYSSYNETTHNKESTMANEAKQSLLETKQVDLTVADGLKINAMTSVVTAVAMTVTPLIIGATCTGTKSAWHKFQERRAAKKATTPPEA